MIDPITTFRCTVRAADPQNPGRVLSWSPMPGAIAYKVFAGSLDAHLAHAMHKRRLRKVANRRKKQRRQRTGRR